jgi:DNA invertase Pin-like site-specific DNA recombinase
MTARIGVAMSIQNRAGRKNHNQVPEPAPLIPAAQYVRMSDEAQQYSIENQKTAIQEYAATHGFLIVKTYADSGKSGVIAKNRPALRELLSDVVSGTSGYKSILVYDVSRWRRFPNNDEAAHYEFLCSSSGIPLHYCAEPFVNDGTATGSLLKALKRSMAAEFSRELGEKVFRGKVRIVQLGFWVGGPAGYGYRRLMVSAEGKPKATMKHRERKSLTTDRVILIPGPQNELHCVRRIFSMAIEGKGGAEIARELNGKNIAHYGKPWLPLDVRNIVRNPKYAGCNVWYRHSQRLRGTKRIRIGKDQWITKPGAFLPIVDKETFDRAQECFPTQADFSWSDEEILQRVRRLLKAKGRLSETLLMKARGMPGTTTIHKHFGTYRQLYEKVGYYLADEDIFKGQHCELALKLRRKLVNKIAELFPHNVIVTHLPKRTRSMLLIDNSFMVSILLCRTGQRGRGRPHWILESVPAEHKFITLLCTANRASDRLLGYYVFPRMDWMRFHRLYRNDPCLDAATKLDNLSDFYTVVKNLWVERSADDPDKSQPGTGLRDNLQLKQKNNLRITGESMRPKLLIVHENDSVRDSMHNSLAKPHRHSRSR